MSGISSNKRSKRFKRDTVHFRIASTMSADVTDDNDREEERNRSPCMQFRSGVGYSGFNLFGGGCLNTNLPTLPARELEGDYDLLYLNYIRHHIISGRMKYVTVEHQQTAKGSVVLSAVESSEGTRIQYKVSYDCGRMDLPFELVCTNNFCFTESVRTVDQIQFHIEDDEENNQPHPYQDISEGPVWGCISVLEKPIAIGWLPGYRNSSRMVRDRTDDEYSDDESTDSVDTIESAACPYERSKAIELPEGEAQAAAMNKAYYDTKNSWLCRHELLPPELAMVVRTFMYPPPALVFQRGDIWFSACWNDDETDDGITWSTIARPRVQKIL
mmetsp:Transcript_19930/g.29655  ORF Transcript_19930/g.29655 Transcript_19930/m.29655 type:complete len:329 (-) Transcript_19930:132-1118(-)